MLSCHRGTAAEAGSVPVPASPWPLFWAVALGLLFAAGRLLPAARFFDNPDSYLPLHIGLEFVSLVVCAMVVTLGWSLRDSERNGHAVLIGAGFLFVGLAVFAHTLSYKGMPNFVTASGAEKAINFWLAERLGTATAMLGLVLLPARSWPRAHCLLAYAIATGAAAISWWLGLFHADWLPHTYITGTGLTPFKIGAEYALSAVDIATALALLHRGRRQRNGTALWLGAATWIQALSGLFFSLYADVTDTFNLLGHLYKAAAYWMVYRALFAAGVQAPFRILKQERKRIQSIGEERLRMVLDAARMNVFEYDAQSDRVERMGQVSEALGLISGVSKENFFEQLHPDDRPRFLSIIQGLSPGRPTYAFEYRFRGSDGSYHWLLDQARAQFDEQGRPLRLLGVCTDISERKQAEIALARHAERQALLLDIASSMLQAGNDKAEMAQTIFEKVGTHFDADVCLNYRIDDKAGELELVAGYGIPDQSLPPARRLALGRSFCGTVAATGTSLTADARRIGDDENGSLIRALGIRAYACHPLIARDGRMLGTFALASTRRDSFKAEDIDFLQTIAYFLALAWERRRAEQEIQRLNADLEHRVAERTAELQFSNKELQGFTYAASHDMKGPLGRINSFSTLLEQKYRDRLEGDGLLFLDLIRRNTLRLTHLIDDLLAHAQIEQRRLEGESADLRAAVQLVLAEKEEDIREAGAEITLDLPDTDMQVRGDFHSLTQVLRNLLENALKYSAAATPPLIDIGCRQEGENRVLWVRDNGIGFDMAYHNRIFEIFRRLHTYDEFPGSGVGLALVKKAMERMGGKVWAESAPGRGATFFLQLQAVPR